MRDDEDDDEVRDRNAKVTAYLTDRLPEIWHGMYANLVVAGFDRDDALKLVRTYIIGTCISAHGVHCT